VGSGLAKGKKQAEEEEERMHVEKVSWISF
jgi:hypothetical protein